MPDVGALRARVAAVRARVAAAAERVGRDPREVTLIAVTKTMSLETVRLAHAIGLCDLGENRVQEAEAKYTEFRPAGLRLHLIGPLQTNKARKAVALFDVVHSLDRVSLGDLLDAECGRRGREPLPVLVEVNVSGEESKHGLAPDAVAELLRRAPEWPHLLPVGLMTMAPLAGDPEEVRPVFRYLRELREECQSRLQLALPHLSMGMTNDFEVAVEEGATMIRVGRAIFGERG